MSPAELHPCPLCAAEVDSGSGIHHIAAGHDADPIDVLLRDHEFLTCCLDRIEKASAIILAEGFSVETFDVIVDAVQHISREIRGHHHREEMVLMPFLRRHIGENALELPDSHLELWNALEHVVGNIRSVEEGRLLGLSVEGLIQSVVLVAGAIREHLLMENNDLFPLAKKLLTEEEYADLSNSMSRALEH